MIGRLLSLYLLNLVTKNRNKNIDEEKKDQYTLTAIGFVRDFSI